MLVSSRANTTLLVLILAVGIGIVAMLATGVRGGPLDPPGPPGATDSVRLPGTPISGPTTIAQPGHYYLTKDISFGGAGTAITISASDVTLDLGGFTIDGDDAVGGSGIAVSGSPVAQAVEIRNGHVRDFQFGIVASAGEAVVIDNVLVASNVRGVELGQRSVIKNCTVVDSTETGIYVPGSRAVVRDCFVTGNAGPGVTLSGSWSTIESSVVVQNNTSGAVGWRDVVVSDGVYNALRGNTVGSIRVTVDADYTAVTDNYCGFGALTDESSFTYANEPDHANIKC